MPFRSDECQLELDREYRVGNMHHHNQCILCTVQHCKFCRHYTGHEQIWNALVQCERGRTRACNNQALSNDSYGCKKNNLYAIDDRIRWLWNIDGCTGITAINKKWLGHSSCCVSFFWCCVLLCPIAFVSLWTISFPEREKYTRYHIHNLSLFIGCAMR